MHMYIHVYNEYTHVCLCVCVIDECVERTKGIVRIKGENKEREAQNLKLIWKQNQDERAPTPLYLEQFKSTLI